VWDSRDGYIRDAQRKRYNRIVLDSCVESRQWRWRDNDSRRSALARSGMNSVKNIEASEVGESSQNPIVCAPHSPTSQVASGGRPHGLHKKVFPRVQEQRLQLDRRPRAPSTREARRHPRRVLRRRRTARRVPPDGSSGLHHSALMALVCAPQQPAAPAHPSTATWPPLSPGP
jgi:hypothetical protein